MIMRILKKIVSILANKSFKKTKFKVKNNNFSLQYFYLILIILIMVIVYIITNSISKTLIITSINLNVFCIFHIINLKKDVAETINQRFEIQEKNKQKEKEIISRKKFEINRLIVLDENGDDFLIKELEKDEYIIGKKNSTVDIDIDLTGLKDDDMISRIHAKIFKVKNTWQIEDLKSKNGTFLLKLNRRILVKENPEKIKIGDIIEINKVKILVN